MLRRLLPLLLILLALPGVVQARAYYAPKAEMIQRAEVIALVQILMVEKTDTKRKSWTYRQKATARVEQVLKGKVPQEITLYGQEDFICGQCRFAPGRYLLFLKRDEDLLVGSNWQFSIRPITGDQVEWYAGDKSLELKPAPLAGVLQEIRRLL
jgi:hypothetical protein